MAQKRNGQLTTGAVIVMSLAAFFALFVLALLLVQPLGILLERSGDGGEERSLRALPPQPKGRSSQELDAARPLHVLVDGAVVETNLADYLYSVVAAEMPAAFELEALKAQAVAARTYTVNKLAVISLAHPHTDMCSDITCCQAYITPEQARSNWGEHADFYEEKIRSAVAGTDGLVALYEGKAIDAVFHSSSSGSTLDAVSVWGGDVPYLKSVSSPEGIEVPGWEQENVFTREEARQRTTARYPEAVLPDAMADWFTNWNRFPNGTVDHVTLGGVTLRGTQVRSLFGLRSAAFTVETGDALRFSVRGYGHGVGMSQYGANAMAKNGADFAAIIRWYYTGVDVDYLESEIR